jgi:hypothetical protein
MDKVYQEEIYCNEETTMNNSIKGSEIKISHDRIDGKDFIIIKDQSDNLILKVDYELWNSKENIISGFDTELKSKILNKIMEFFG